MVTNYDAFLRALDAYGFLPLGGALPIVTLEELTEAAAWHCGDAARDPWAWRMRLCTQKDGAYARILFGRPTLVSPAWYGVFARAFSATDSIEARYARGECDPLMRKIAQLFEQRPVFSRHALHTALGRRAVSTAQLDRALTGLERTLHITISGETQRIAQNGAPYGWPSAEYMRADVFAPPTWRACGLTREQAREKIVEKARETAPALTKRDIARLLG